MSKVYCDGDGERLSRCLADHLTIGPDGMTPADHRSARRQVSIAVATPMSVTAPQFDDVSAVRLALLTQDVLASLTPSLATDPDVGPDSTSDGGVSTARRDWTADAACLNDDEILWALFVESWHQASQPFGTHVH